MRRALFLGGSMGAGGITQVFLNVAKTLEDAGWEVKVVSPYRIGVAGLGIPSRYIVGYAWRYKLRILWLRRALRVFHWLTNWWFYFLFAKKYQHDVFVIFAGNMWPEWCHYSSKPKILWLHGADAIRKDTILTGFIVRKIRNLTEQVDNVVAVTEFVRNYWQTTFSPRRSNSLVIYNYIDVSLIRQLAGDEILEKTKGPGPNLVYVGRISKEKGVDRLLSAVKKLKVKGYKFTLTIVGPGGVSDSDVDYVGEKKNPYPYIKRADLLVLPSIHEGASLVVCEALALRTPVIATNCGGPCEILQNETFGRLVENSEQGLYRGLKDFLDDRRSVFPYCKWSEVEEKILERNASTRSLTVSLFDVL